MWRRVGRDALILGSSALSLVVFQFAYRYLSVRELSIAHYGRVALLLSIFNAATVLGTYGIPPTASRLAARTFGKGRDRQVLRASSLAMLGPCAAATVAMTVATYVLSGSWVDALVAAIGTPPFIWAGLYRGFIRGKGMIWSSAAIQPANLILQTVALLVFVAAGVNVGVGWVLASFYIGNFGAYACGRVFMLRALRRSSAVEDEADVEATPRRILNFAAWMSLANLAILLLEIVPRVALAHFSYREVAYFDLALLIYTIPQRLRSVFLVSIVPIAAVARKNNMRITVPSNKDLALVTAVFLALDGVLWVTHALQLFLRHVGMGGYVGAEPLLLIFLLAAPAEIFYGLTSGLLQAFGQSRRLSVIAMSVLATSVALAPFAASVGPSWLAALLVVDYWALHLLTRRMLYSNGVEEESVLVSPLVSRLRQWRVRVAEVG